MSKTTTLENARFMKTTNSLRQSTELAHPVSRRSTSKLAGLLLVAAAALSIFGCRESGVGDPCVPEDEFEVDFAGFAKEEVNVESRSFQCETRVCLVNNFKGRVSCPYGGTGCQLPDFSGTVEVEVPAQLVERPPNDAVYCSCRCDGPSGSNAPFCECPSGFTCEQLVDDLDLGKKELVGSYCVKEGKQVDDPLSLVGEECRPGEGNCEGRIPF